MPSGTKLILLLWPSTFYRKQTAFPNQLNQNEWVLHTRMQVWLPVVYWRDQSLCRRWGKDLQIIIYNMTQVHGKQSKFLWDNSQAALIPGCFTCYGVRSPKSCPTEGFYLVQRLGKKPRGIHSQEPPDPPASERIFDVGFNVCYFPHLRTFSFPGPKI